MKYPFSFFLFLYTPAIPELILNGGYFGQKKEDYCGYNNGKACFF